MSILSRVFTSDEDWRVALDYMSGIPLDCVDKLFVYYVSFWNKNVSLWIKKFAEKSTLFVSII